MIRETSRETYFDLQEEGLLGEMQLRTLWQIKLFPPRTDREIADNMGFSDPNNVRPRRKELVDLGLVREAGKRVCSISNRQALTWEVVPDWEIADVRAKRNEVKIRCPMCDGKGTITVGQQTL